MHALSTNLEEYKCEIYFLSHSSIKSMVIFHAYKSLLHPAFPNVSQSQKNTTFMHSCIYTQTIIKFNINREFSHTTFTLAKGCILPRLWYDPHSNGGEKV